MNDTILVAIIDSIISLILGFMGGYKIGQKSTKIQKARDNAIQIQGGDIYGKSNSDCKR